MACSLLSRPPCANCERENDSEICEVSPCLNEALLTCDGCYLVQYCSRECQKAHWKVHKIDCRSSLMSKDWKPAWALQRRQPAFLTMDNPVTTPTFWGASHGKRKYLWGNVPAFDLLNLDHNERKLPSQLHLLFAASGDIRNVVQTVASLPSTYTGDCEIIINDRDSDIVARNIILLLIALHYTPEEATPIMLHIWYSALVPKAMIGSLRENIAPMIEDVCSKIKHKSTSSTLQAKTWKFGSSSLRLMLGKPFWDSLLPYFDIPIGLSMPQAQRIRTATTLAPDRVDYVDRALYNRPPGWRSSMMKFRTDGILLPFGGSRKEFDTPNPTFYQSKDFWPMMDSADPLEGWPADAVLKKAPIARKDVYGSLFFYVQDKLLQFCKNVQRLNISFQVFQLDARVLAQSHLSKDYFDRIEISNIADGGYLGASPALSTFAPLLKTPSTNAHATLITLFLNACHEVYTPADTLNPANIKEEMDKLLNLMPFDPRVLRSENPADPDLLRMNDARMHFRDFDKFFDRYMQKLEFGNIGRQAGLVMKKKNTVIEKWPLRLKKGATEEEFRILHSSGHVGSERYVEWKRVA